MKLTGEGSTNPTSPAQLRQGAANCHAQGFPWLRVTAAQRAAHSLLAASGNFLVQSSSSLDFLPEEPVKERTLGELNMSRGSSLGTSPGLAARCSRAPPQSPQNTAQGLVLPPLTPCTSSSMAGAGLLDLHEEKPRQRGLELPKLCAATAERGPASSRKSWGRELKVRVTSGILPADKLLTARRQLQPHIVYCPTSPVQPCGAGRSLSPCSISGYQTSPPLLRLSPTWGSCGCPFPASIL